MFGKNVHVSIVLSVAALALIIAPASATTIKTYTDLPAWQAATTPLDCMNFETGVLNDGSVAFGGLGGATVGTFDTSNPQNPWYDFHTGTAAFINIGVVANLPAIKATLSTPVTALAFNLFSGNPNGLSFTVNVFTAATYAQGAGTPYTVTTSPLGGAAAFFAITSDAPLTFIDFGLQGPPQGAYEFIDNFRTGTASVQATPADAPEAATFLLIGSGLVGLMGLRKRILKNKSVRQVTPALSAC
jgi:hypothetical protein